MRNVQTERNKEIRRILSGFVTCEEGGALLTAARNILQIQSDGTLAGTGKAQTLGVREKLVQFRFEGDTEQVYAACQDAFSHLGRRLYLYSAPDALAILYRPIFRFALVVTLEGTEEELLLGLYTARSLLSGLNLRWASKRITEELPALLQETVVTMIPESENPGEEAREPEEKEEKPAKKVGRRSFNGQVQHRRLDERNRLGKRGK